MRSKKLEGLRSNCAVSQASGMAKYLLVLRVLIFISSVSRGLCVQETLGSNCRLHLDWIYGPLFLSAFHNMSAECARFTGWLSFLPTPKIRTTSNGVRSTTIYSCLLNGRFWTNSTPNFSKYKSIIAVQYIASCLFNISWKYKGVRSHSMDRAKWNRNGTALTLVKVLARCKRRRERERGWKHSQCSHLFLFLLWAPYTASSQSFAKLQPNLLRLPHGKRYIYIQVSLLSALL